MGALFSLLSIVSAGGWLYILSYFLKEVQVGVEPLEEITLDILWFAWAGISVWIGNILAFMLYQRLQKHQLSKKFRNLFYLASVIGLNLSLLLRTVLIVRMEVEENMAVNLQRTFALSEHQFFFYIIGGGLSGTVIMFCVANVLNVLQSSETTS